MADEKAREVAITLFHSLRVSRFGADAKYFDETAPIR
jgi:hypothetical protein